MTLMCGLEDLPPYLERDLPDIELVTVPNLVRAISPARDWRCYRDLCKIITNRRFDVVHTHTSKAGILGRLAAHRAGCRHIIHTPHGSVHLPQSNIPGIPNISILKRLLLFAEYWAGRRTTCIVSLSNAEREHFIKQRLGAASNTHVIYNGIDLQRFSPQPRDDTKATRLRYGMDDDGVLVASAGRLTAEKGHHLAVEAMAKIADREVCRKFALVIAGDGPERNALETAIRNSGLEQRVMLTGFVDDMPGLLAAADLFVLPSHYEGFGLAAVEAMAAGLPVIASRVGGIPEIITDGVDGFLFERGNVGELAQHLSLLAADRIRRQDIGQKAAVRAQAFSVTTMCEAYYALYDGQ